MSTSRALGGARWLDDDEERAWRAFRRMTVGVFARTAQDLGDVGLSEADYEVLSTLSEQPDRRSRLRDQAAKTAWSRSRLSRHTSRMEQRGLISREDDPDDGRGCLLVLTSKGSEQLGQVAPMHVDSVHRHFIDRLTASDLRAIVRIADRLDP